MIRGKYLRNIIIAILLTVSISIIIYIIHDQEIISSDGATEHDKIILTVLAGQSTTDAGIEDIINEALGKKFPDVQLDWECVDWGEDFDLQMQMRYASGDIPDLIVGKAQDVYKYSSLGNLAPIPSTCINKIDEKALQAVTFDGTVLGLPYNSFYQGVIYNKNLFKKYNLNIPTTQNDLKEIVSVLAKNNITPFAAHFLESWQIGNMTMQLFANDIFKDKTDWGNQFRDGRVNFKTNDAVQNCLLQNQFILKKTWPDAMDIDQYECDRRFNEGKAAMYLTGSWWMQSISSVTTENTFGIFPYPNLTGDSKLLRETNITFMKSNASKYSELVDQILEELVTNTQLTRDVLDFTQTYSVLKGVSPMYNYCIDKDVNSYEKNHQVIEITSDNNQLLWAYQNKVALKQQEWLHGKITLEEVLDYADRIRQESN